MRLKELQSIEDEIKRLQDRQKQLEDEAQQEFLDNIKDKSLALQTFLKRCKDDYDLSIKSAKTLGMRIDFSPILGSLGIGGDVRELDIYTYPIIEQIFTELYKEEHILTAANPMYGILDGEIFGYTSKSWYTNCIKEDMGIIKGFVNKFAGVKDVEKKEESKIIYLKCQVYSFDIDINNIESTINTIRSFAKKYKIAHLYIAGVYKTTNHVYKMESRRLDIKGVFFNTDN